MSESNNTIKCSIHTKAIESDVTFASLTEVVSQKEHPTILGSNNATCKNNRFSAWAFEPKQIFEFASNEKNPFGKLEKKLDKYTLIPGHSNPLPKGMFPGGWMGYFSYDLGHYIEKLPNTTRDDLNLPLIRLCFYDRAICYDHQKQKWHLVALDIEGDSENADAKLDQLTEIVSHSGAVTVATFKQSEFADANIAKLDCNISRDYYFHAIDRTKQYIHDGDVYQINFSQRFRCDYKADPVKLYHWQNQYNPSPYAAYIKADEFSIVSASPELFLEIQDGVISTKPIKGTRPRMPQGKNADEINRVNYTELVKSEKDQAELYMIIDLERNDLTRICQYGTIEVVQPRTIEAYPTVFHAVATVQGRLRDAQSPKTFCDILKATFPGGSITGAPKIRSMEIIDELEPTARGVYTGSVGFIGIDSNACLNIAIRTVIIKDDSAYVQTGGGIVADSDPRAEWDETITKARALLDGIAAVQK